MTGFRYPEPLVEGVYLRRYKRFFADVRLPDGREVVAHCANTGRMTGVDLPGAPCRVLASHDPKRKLKWSLEQIWVQDAWMMVHTARPNRVVEAAIALGQVGDLAAYPVVQRERPYGDRSRIDLLLSDPDGERPDCYVEVKNVTLLQDGQATFPDAVSARGAKHMDELAQAVAQGHRAVLVPHIAHPDARRFAPADDVDPAWGAAFRTAVDAGVEVMPVVVRCTPEGVDVVGHVPWVRRSTTV